VADKGGFVCQIGEEVLRIEVSQSVCKSNNENKCVFKVTTVFLRRGRSPTHPAT